MYKEYPVIYNFETLLYGRKSRSDDPLLSLEEVLAKHNKILEDYARKHLGGPIPEENTYQEVASSETLDGRPEMLRLLKAIESPAIKAILVVEVQRLSRGDLEDAGRLIKILRYTNTLVITPTKTYDLRDEYDRDAFERELKRGNEYLEYFKKIQQRGKLESVKEGNYIQPQPPYGYDKIMVTEGNKTCPTLKINEEEAEIVRMIFNWYLQGCGVRKIQFMLEQEGRKTAEGKTNWHASVISKTLKRKFYCGLLDYGQQFSEDYKSQKRRNNYGERDRVVIQGQHEPIVSLEEFEKVQEIMENHRKQLSGIQTGPKGSGQKQKKDVWSKLLVCICGHSFNRHKWAHKNSNTVYGYQCYSSVRSGTVQTRLNKGLSIEGVCTSPMIPQWKLKMMAKYVFTNFITDVDEILKTANNFLQKHIADKPIRDNTKIIENKRKELSKLEKRLKNYTEMRADGEITRERFFEYKAELVKERLVLPNVDRANTLINSKRGKKTCNLAYVPLNGMKSVASVGKVG